MIDISEITMRVFLTPDAKDGKRYKITSPYRYDDGEPVVMYLEQSGVRYRITDLGYQLKRGPDVMNMASALHLFGIEIRKSMLVKYVNIDDHLSVMISIAEFATALVALERYATHIYIDGMMP